MYVAENFIITPETNLSLHIELHDVENTLTLFGRFFMKILPHFPMQWNTWSMSKVEVDVTLPMRLVALIKTSFFRNKTLFKAIP